jgi:hypothetical protein
VPVAASPAKTLLLILPFRSILLQLYPNYRHGSKRCYNRIPWVYHQLLPVPRYRRRHLSSSHLQLHLDCRQCLLSNICYENLRHRFRRQHLPSHLCEQLLQSRQSSVLRNPCSVSFLTIDYFFHFITSPARFEKYFIEGVTARPYSLRFFRFPKLEMICQSFV